MKIRNKWFIYLSMIFLSGLIILTPIFRGLYFEREWYMVHLISFSIFLIWCLLRLIRKETAPFLQNSMDYAALALVLSYLLSLYGAVFPRAAIGELLKLVNYFIIYILVLDIIRKAPSPKTYIILLLNTFLAAGTLVSIIGLAGASGALQIPGLFDGMRIHSTLQYHNANGIYLSAMFLLALGLTTQMQKWFFRLPYLALAFLFSTSVVFSFSRGAWLVLALLSLFYLIFTIPGQRLKSTIHLLIILTVTILAFPPLEHLIQQKEPARFFTTLLLLTLVTVAAGAFIELCTTKKAARPKIKTALFVLFIALPCLLLPIHAGNASTKSTFFLPSASPSPLQHREQIATNANYPTITAIPLPIAKITANATLTAPRSGLLPSQIQDRLSEIDLQTKSAKDRFIYFQSALKIARDYPLTGAGGGAWEALYLSYLRGYYTGIEYTVEPHNHYFKILVESGALGLLAILALCFFFSAGFFRYRFSKKVPPHQKQLLLVIFAPAAVIAVHSTIDFGLSLGAISIFFWILLAMGSSMLLPRENSPITSEQGRPAGEDDKTGTTASTPNPVYRRFLPNLLCLAVTIFLLIFTSNLYSGYRHTLEAQIYLQQEENRAAAIYHLEEAIARDPYRATNYLELATLYEKSLQNMKVTDIDPSYLRIKTLDLAARAASLEPFNHVLAARYGTLLINLGEKEQGLETLSKLPHLYPYNPEIYKHLAGIYLQAARENISQGHTQTAHTLIDRIKELAAMMEQHLGDAGPLHPILEEAVKLQY